MKLGILGGSFNPVHLGHLFLANSAISALNLDRVVFVPAFCSPFKTEAEGMTEEGTGNRLDMLAAAVSSDHRFAIDSCEIKRQGVSYTIDTLEDIIARFLPQGKPYLIIGDDLAADLPKWNQYEKILELAVIAIARRKTNTAVKHPFPCVYIENEIMNISSQMIRQKIKDNDIKGSDWHSLVPSAVSAIIQDRRLYGCSSNSSAALAFGSDKIYDSVIQKVEAAARETLTIERFLHSRNTALHAYDMCSRFGLDPAAGYLAGIAHDLAKQLDNKQILKIIKSERIPVSSLEKNKPNLLHGKAAAVLLRDRFSIHNEDVLEAVACHTSGNEKMGALAKVIYIADKTESSRNIDPALRIMCREADLDSILFAVLEKTIMKLKAKELDLSKDTIMLLNKIKEKKT
ncbi:MAG: nicotinate (nicotinamide) nucleotide adenylyltransferase [Treponema sp.]|nr:nicotinate (nicotinamide) nucleotide adenylyltransferase [Treponema sp.]